ncbi:MAG: DUF3489 domain-containing protein [Rhizobiaceae bacterium]|nr:DUF3489 domain-containing protein [Rhizobiaceae bacterium]
MSKINLTDKQRAVLSAATRTAGLTAWPLPKKLGLSAGSAAIVVRGLLQKGLLEKRPALGADPVWKEEDGKRFTLVVTKAGLAACGITAAVEPATKAPVAADKALVAAVSHDQPRRPRPGTKLAVLIEMLERKGGATVAEMADATGWLSHSVRGVLSAALIKKFGLVVASEKIEGRGRIYRLRSRRLLASRIF